MLVLFLAGGLSAAEAGSNACPAEYGKVLYECNPGREKQLFIIGMGHRDALTGANGPRTVKIQAEVYKMGEWLIREEGVELLLPEGFFKGPGGSKTSGAPAPNSDKKKSAAPLDLQALEAKLADRNNFVNAEILLKRNYPIVLQQVEDKRCYEEVSALMGRAFGGQCPPDEFTRAKAELDFLQDKRTAVMLQKIPEIINREYAERRIHNPKAIFTIGLAHIAPILKYLGDGGIRPAANQDFQELNLQRHNYRVSVLIPRSLAEDPILLKINGLGKNHFGSPPSPGKGK